MATSIQQFPASAHEHLSVGDGAGALALLEAAQTEHPKTPDILVTLGVAYRFCAKLEEAAACFDAALKLQPGRADAEVKLDRTRLALGDGPTGWKLYQSRWRDPGWTQPLRYPAEEMWRGTITPNMRLLVWAEQGFGDTIQFARYVPWLAHRLRQFGGSIVFEVPAPLTRLFRSSWPALDIVEKGHANGRFDAHLPLMDLPVCFGGRLGSSGLPYLPAGFPYLRAGTPSSHQPPSEQGAKSKTVGITWQGRPTHPDDAFRSLPMEALAPLFQLPGIRWVSLQKDTPHPPELTEDVAGANDFLDTAQVASRLDLVISIDSAVAHLAGGLGLPTWMILPEVCDWRWGIAGAETPWYPTMRLFRQTKGTSPASQIETVATALREWVDQPGAPALNSP